MAISNINTNPLAAVALAVSAILSGYDAIASEQVSPRAEISPASPAPVLAVLTAVKTNHQKALKMLKDCATQFEEMNKHARARGYPKHMLTDEYGKQLVGLIFAAREIEASTKKAKVPIGLETQHAELRRALAETRSEIVVSFELVRQTRGTPTEFDGRVDLEGLRALAERSTKRLLELANT